MHPERRIWENSLKMNMFAEIRVSRGYCRRLCTVIGRRGAVYWEESRKLAEKSRTGIA